jgi:hypothetical protein
VPTKNSISWLRIEPRRLEDARELGRKRATVVVRRRVQSNAGFGGGIADGVVARLLGLMGCGWVVAGLGGVPFVPVMKTADLRDRHDRAVA